MSNENGRLPTVDAVLEQFSRVSVPTDIEQKLDARLKKFLQQPEPQIVLSRPTNLRHSRQRFIQVSMAATLGVLVCAALLVVFSGRDAWAQVVRTVRSKPWVRYQHTIQVPKDSPATETTWFSTEHKVIASRTGQKVVYIDLTSEVIYEYSPQSKSLMLSQSHYHDNIKSGLLEFDAMLRLVLEGANELELPGSSIRTLERTQSEVQEGDRRWTEFKFDYRDSQRRTDELLMIVRVNPETHLPVEVRFTSKSTPSIEIITLAIDYPETGPSDIYALGVPRDATIVDRRGSTTENSEEIKSFLAAYEQARRKPFEPFSMTVLNSLPEKDFTEIYQAFRGLDNGKDVRLEEANQQDLFEITRQYRAGLISRAKDADCAEWWKQQTAGLTFTPMLQYHDCLLPNRVGYPELMGLGQSPIGNPDCHVTLDRHPRTGPPGTVLLNIRVETTVGFNDMYFWIAPEKDYLVIRHEIHYSKNREAWNNSTQIIDKLEQSPKGRWYATKVRTGRIEKHGADLPMERVAVGPVHPTDKETEMGPVTTHMYRYLVDFK